MIDNDCYIWGGKIVAGPYPLELRRMALRAIRVVGDPGKPPYLPPVPLDDPKISPEVDDPDHVDAFAFLAALDWLSVAYAVKVPRLDCVELKFVTEHFRYDGIRPSGSLMTSRHDGIYAARTITGIALAASGLPYRTVKWNRMGGVHACAAFKRKEPPNIGTSAAEALERFLTARDPLATYIGPVVRKF
ncbi:MAG: hypothetical protein J0H44_13615 [Alphaproteobacteria bacterium]|nr:hypothetical protein [Alphaproteobacteria bacterium]